MRWRAETLGDRVHVRVFTAPIASRKEEPKPGAFQFAGRLVFRAGEWADVVALLGPQVEVVYETN
jgi:hypothetical protein